MYKYKDILIDIPGFTEEVVIDFKYKAIIVDGEEKTFNIDYYELVPGENFFKLESDGNVEIEFKFNISYNTFKTNYNPHWDTLDAVLENGETLPITFAPKVGDIVRVKMIDDPNVFRDYTITFVNDTNLSKDGISPLMTNYCWECSITRRKPSYEEIDVVDDKGIKVEQMEKGLESVLNKQEQQDVQTITREEEVYNYDDQFADVNGILVDNIDVYKDAVYGSMNSLNEKERD